MNEYVVKMKSSTGDNFKENGSGHGFEFITIAKNKSHAYKKAKNKLEENGWLHYGYRLIRVDHSRF